MKRPLIAIAVLLLAIPLMGMKCSAEGTVECKSGCGVKGTVRGEWEMLRNLPGGDRLLALADTFDAALWVMDVSQSNVTMPATGSVTIKLVNTATGAVRASATFPWTRTGNLVKLANPNAVNTWAAQNGGDADTLTYELAQFQTSQSTGTNTLAVAQKYNGDLLSAASTTWTGQVCPNDPLVGIRYCPDP